MCIFKPKLTLPHTENKPGVMLLTDLRCKFYTDYQVSNPEYWNNISVIITGAISTPGLTIGNQILINPEWTTPGVLAHEAAHISYSLLSEYQKERFAITYHAIKDTDKYIKLLYSINDYGLTNDTEAHAEIYRYLQGKIPESLLSYYPELI